MTKANICSASAMAEWSDTPLSLHNKKIWVAGHTGLVGSALVRHLKRAEECTVLTPGRADLDCRDQAAVKAWMDANRPDLVIVAAAHVGGIGANINAPAPFLYDNLMIGANIIHAAYQAGVEKLLYLGSSCIYPRVAVNPISENQLLTGPLEPTNAPYALAKITGIKLCEAYRAQYGCNFISAMPCNLYGPGDRFEEERSHVIPALLQKAHQVKREGGSIFEIWGSGRPRREFLYVDDLAEAILLLLKRYNGAMPVNVGAGNDITIEALARKIMSVSGINADLKFDETKPDGVMQKLLDSSRIQQAGWSPRISLDDGLARTYEWYCRHGS